MIDPAPTDGTISDDNRRRIEAALAAALVLIYSGKRAQALAQLGQTVDAMGVSLQAHDKILSFAADRAQLIQDGINERMQAADDPEAAASEIDQYNQDTLQPYMEAWAAQQGLSDAYQETPGENGGTAADDHLWVWTRNTDWIYDDCQAAEDASPAAKQDLVDIAGGEPPVHLNCQCTLDPE